MDDLKEFALDMAIAGLGFPLVALGLVMAYGYSLAFFR
jgi:nitrate reductase NapE component